MTSHDTRTPHTDHFPDTIVSRHATSEGVVVWSRCACGRLQMVLVPYSADGGRLAATARAVPCAACAGGPDEPDGDRPGGADAPDASDTSGGGSRDGLTAGRGSARNAACGSA